MTTADCYADEDRLIDCDSCDRRVNIEDSSYVPPEAIGAEGRLCYVCCHTEAIWQQCHLMKPTWETKGRYDDK
jgi:hypothetical protein